MTPELQQLLSDLEQGRVTVEELNESFSGLTDSTVNQTSAMDNLSSATTSTISGLSNFTKSVAAGSGEMGSISGVVRDLSSAIGDAIPFVGGMAKGMGEVTAFAIDRLQASFSAFQDLADAGAIGAEGIEGLRDQFDAAGIPLEKYASMLKSNSEDLSFVFGSALKGSENFSVSMKTMMDGSNTQLRNLGFTVEEVGDTVVNFQKMQNRLGFSQQMTQDQLKKSANAYGTELDLLSKLTGESKKQLQDERDARMLDARYRAHLSTLTKEQAMATEQYMALQRKLGPEQEKQAMASITGLVTTSDAIKAEINGTGEVHRNFAKSVKEGDLSVQNMVKYTKMSGEAQGKFAKSMTGYYLAAGDDNASLAGYASQLDAQVKAGEMSVDQANELIQAQINQKDKTDETTKTFVENHAKLLKTSVNLDMMSTELSFANEAVDFFATGMVEVTNKLREMIGGNAVENDVTAMMGLRSEEKSAAKEKEKAEQDVLIAKRQGATNLEIAQLQEIANKKKAAHDKSTDRITELANLNANDFMKQRALIKEISTAQREVQATEQKMRQAQQEYATLKSKVSIDKDNVYSNDEAGKKAKADRIKQLNDLMEADIAVIKDELKVRYESVKALKTRKEAYDESLGYNDYAREQKAGREGKQIETVKKIVADESLSNKEVTTKSELTGLSQEFKDVYLKMMYDGFQQNAKNRNITNKNFDPNSTMKDSMWKAEGTLQAGIDNKTLEGSYINPNSKKYKETKAELDAIRNEINGVKMSGPTSRTNVNPAAPTTKDQAAIAKETNEEKIKKEKTDQERLAEAKKLTGLIDGLLKVMKEQTNLSAAARQAMRNQIEIMKEQLDESKKQTQTLQS